MEGAKKMAPLLQAGGAMNPCAALGRVNENYAGFWVRIISLPADLLPLAKYHTP
jgi:hypothetical protein